MENKNVRLATKLEIFKYSFGGIGSNISYGLLSAYLMFFYTDVFGISALSVGTLFLVSRLIDAITDPVMGMIADRTRSKFGKYRPWIMFISPFLGLSLILLFFTPDFDYNQKIIYAYVTYILYSLISTMVNIPYHSLTPVLSEDSTQRTQVASAKQIMGIPATLFVNALSLPIVAMFGGGENGWLCLSVLVAIILIPSFWLCASGAKRHDIVEPLVNGKAKNITVKDQISSITKNKPLLLLMVAFLVQNLSSSIASSVNMYYMSYNVGRVDLIPLIGLLTVLMAIPVAIFLPSLSKRFDKKSIFIFGNILSAVMALLVYFTPVNNIVMVVVMMVLSTGSGQIAGIIGWAMLADCVDYAEWKLGIRADGTVSSSHTFINKCGMAFGGLIAGAALSAVGYVAGAQQTPVVLQTIVSMKSLVPMTANIIAMIFVSRYPITNKFYKQILQDIKIRKASENTNL